MRSIVLAIVLVAASCTTSNPADLAVDAGADSAIDFPLDLTATVVLADLDEPAADALEPADVAQLADVATPRDLQLTGTALCKARGCAGGCGTGGLNARGCLCDDGTACGYCDCTLPGLGGACVNGHCGACARCVCQ